MVLPLVSIIVPVYNAEKFVEACLKSIQAQTFDHFEVIVVDDGTPDHSVELVKPFLSDIRFRLVHQANRGLAGARNTGIRESQGDYIALLDADDLWLPDKLKCHVQHLECSPEVGISFSRSEFIDIDGKHSGTYVMSKLTNHGAEDILYSNPIGNGSSAIIRRQVLDEISFISKSPHTETQFFDERFRRAEDYELWVRIALRTSWKFGGLPEPLTLYRVNDAGLSAKLEAQYQATEQVLAAISAYAPDFISRHGSMARACNAKYIARSAIRQEEYGKAIQFIFMALRSNSLIIMREPRSTILIVCAALLMGFFPKQLTKQIESSIKVVFSYFQAKQIQKDTLNQRITFDINLY